MRRMARRAARIAPVAFVLSLALAGAAAAQYREFTGKIGEISQSKMTVETRMGDKVSFERLEETKVEDESGGDEPKSRWMDMRSEDWVTVKWKMMDKPRKAYEVILLQSKKAAGKER